MVTNALLLQKFPNNAPLRKSIRARLKADPTGASLLTMEHRPPVNDYVRGQIAEVAALAKEETSESGIQKLRKLVNVAGWTSEWAFDDIYDIESTIRLLQACLALDFETLPDMLTPEQRKHAAKTGVLSRAAIKNIYQDEYGDAWEKRLTRKDRALYDSLAKKVTQ